MMAFHVKDEKTAEKSSRAEVAEVPLVKRLNPLQDRLAALSRPGGFPADKTFYDDLSGDV
jgi:hypothetical protein